MNSDREKKNICKWITSAGLIVLLFFIIDIIAVNDTLLTPYEELRPTALPTRDADTGIYYIRDKNTDETYSLDKNRHLVYYDKEKKKIKPLGSKSEQIKLTGRGIIYLHPPVSPLYSFYLPCFSFRLLLPVIIVTAFLFLLSFFTGSGQKTGIKLFFLYLFAVVIRASFAWLRHDFGQMGTELLRYEGESVLFDVPLITDVFEFLKTYPEMMIKLSMNGSHYPPGFALLLKLVAAIKGMSALETIKANINIFGWVILMIGSVSVYPLYLLIKEFFDDRTAIIGVIVFIFMPNTIIYGAVSLDSIFVMLALWPVYFLVRAEKDNLICSILAGLFLGIAVFFSFSGIPVGLLMALFILLKMLQSGENLLKYLKISCLAAAGFFSFFLFLYGIFGFNLIECFLTAQKLEKLFISGVAVRYHKKAFDDLYLYVIWGNYLAFCIYAGFHNIALFLRNVKSIIGGKIEKLKNSGIFSIAVFVFMIIIGFVYHMETERIWQFVSAFLAVIIAGELQKTASAPMMKNILLLMLTISALSTFLLETVFFTLF
ncbi:MAG: hypothetical protein PHV82_06025 [Victivallaceae bacterium]|nr:hypothetical protein [Victivallaceae bacterium]